MLIIAEKKIFFHTIRQDDIIFFVFCVFSRPIYSLFILESWMRIKRIERKTIDPYGIRDNIIMKQRSMLFSLELVFVISGKHFGIWFVKREFEPLESRNCRS